MVQFKFYDRGAQWDHVPTQQQILVNMGPRFPQNHFKSRLCDWFYIGFVQALSAEIIRRKLCTAFCSAQQCCS